MTKNILLHSGQEIIPDLLPMWTEIHIQPLDVYNMEENKVYWIKHPHITKSVYHKDLMTAIKDFIELWNREKPTPKKVNGQ
jgi:hypothetical protein